MSENGSSAGGERPRDLMFVAPHPDEAGYRVIRSRDERLELGTIRPVREGQALAGEVVRLRQRPEHQQLFEVEVLYKPEETGAAQKSGPAQVASPTYRANWELIFGRRAPREGAEDDTLN